MSQPTDETWFDELKEWSERKLVLLEKYLDGAVRIMQIMGPVYYVDGFAGRGSYGKPGQPQIPGSPLRAAQLAQRYIDEGRSYSLHTINVECDPGTFQGLQQVTAPYQHIAQNYFGTFADNINVILRDLGQRPAVCFLDPFGVDGMDWAAVQRLIRRQSATDLWIRFDVDEVRRRDGWYDKLGQPGADKQFEILLRIYGFTDRDKLHSVLDGPTKPEDRKQAALDLYLQQLRDEFKRAKREGFAEAYRIGSLDEEVKYYLVFASASKKGITLASNVVYGIEEEYKRDIERYREEYQAQTSMLPLLDPKPDEIFEAKVQRLQDMLRTKYKGQTLSRLAIHAGILDQWFGIIKSSHMTKALQGLIKGGDITWCSGQVSDDKSQFTFRA